MKNHGGKDGGPLVLIKGSADAVAACREEVRETAATIVEKVGLDTWEEIEVPAALGPLELAGNGFVGCGQLFTPPVTPLSRIHLLHSTLQHGVSKPVYGERVSSDKWAQG